MALVVMPQQESLGSALGTGLGAGLSSGIETLVNMKLQAMQQRQQQQSRIQGLEALGYAPEQAAQLSTLDPQILNTVIKEGMMGPSQRAMESAITGMPSVTGTGMTGLGALQPQIAPSQVAPSPAAEIPREDVSPPSPVTPVEPAEGRLKAPVEPKMMTKDQKIDEALKLRNDIDRIKSVMASGKLRPKHFNQLSNLVAQKEDTLSKLVISDKKEKAAKDRFDQKMGIEERKLDRQDQQDKIKNKLDQDKINLQIKEAKNKKTQQKLVNKREDRKILDKKYDPYYEKQVENFRRANEDLYALDSLSKINRDPGLKLDSPAWLAISKYAEKLGLPPNTLRGTNTQKIEKLIADINQRTMMSFKGTGIRAAKIIQEAMKKNPSLYQSPEARQYVINSLTKLQKIKLKEANMALDKKKKSDYQYTDGFSEKIIEKMRPEYEKLAKSFENRTKKLKKDVKLQKKQKLYERQQLGYTLGGPMGAAAGGIGSALAGAKLGGALGGAGGPLGAGAGALLGGVGGYLAGGQAGSKLAEMLSSAGDRPQDIDMFLGLLR